MNSCWFALALNFFDLKVFSVWRMILFKPHVLKMTIVLQANKLYIERKHRNSNRTCKRDASDASCLDNCTIILYSRCLAELVMITLHFLADWIWNTLHITLACSYVTTRHILLQIRQYFTNNDFEYRLFYLILCNKQ